MQRTYAVLGQVALAIGSGMAANTAHAVPIVFDFVGTVTGSTVDGAAIGQTVVGQIVVETEGLSRTSRTATSGTGVTYTDAPIDAVDLITSHLTIGGNVHDVGGYMVDQSFMAAFDSSGVPSCATCPVNPDYVTLEDWSMSYGPFDSPPPPGEYFGRRLGLRWSSAALDLLDFSNGFEPLDVASMLTATTLLPSGYYRAETYDCADLRCTGTAWAHTLFRVDTLSIHTPSVPEPGTLALFGIGLLGGAVARRSAVKAR